MSKFSNFSKRTAKTMIWGLWSLAVIALIAAIIICAYTPGRPALAATPVNGAMTMIADGNVIDGTFGKLTATGHCMTVTASSQPAFGVIELPASAAGVTRIAPPGTVSVVRTDANISPGQYIVATANGWAAPLATADANRVIIAGIALSGSAGYWDPNFAYPVKTAGQDANFPGDPNYAMTVNVLILGVPLAVEIWDLRFAIYDCRKRRAGVPKASARRGRFRES